MWTSFSINDITAAKFVRQSAESGKPVVMIAEPTILEPMGIAVKKGEPALIRPSSCSRQRSARSRAIST